MNRLVSAVAVICKRHVLIAVRSPLTTLIEVCYPALAATVLLLLKQEDTATDSKTPEEGSMGSGAEYVCWGSLWAAVFLSTNLKFVENVMEEKETKVREFIKVYGASDLSYWAGHYVFMALYSVVQAILVVGVTGSFLREHLRIVDYVSLFFMIVCFQVSCVSTGMLATSFTDSARASFFFYTVLYIVMLVPFFKSAHDFIANQKDEITAWHLFMSPQASLVCGLDQMLGGFVSTTQYARGAECRCTIHITVLYLMLALDAIVYAFLGWYIHQVRPGPMGIPKRWNFLFQSTYWQAHESLQPRRKVWAQAQVFVPPQNQSDLFEPDQGAQSPASLMTSPPSLALSTPPKSYTTSAVSNATISPPVSRGGSPPLIVVDQLHKIYITKRVSWERLKNWMKRKLDIGVVQPPSGQHVLKGVSFNVYEDQILVVMGRNGSGTSTLLSILGGLQDATSGNVFVAGHDIHRNIQAARRRIGYCPQSNFFLDKMTVGEQLSFAAALKGVPSHIAKCDIEVTLKMLELYDKVNWLPHRLSHGEKKRLAVALALIGNPRCIIIDDLSTGLDVLSRRVIWRTLRDMKHNRAIIVSTHCPDEADFIADKMAVLESGCLKALGAPLFLKSRFDDGYFLSVFHSGVVSNLHSKVLALLDVFTSNIVTKSAFGVQLTFKLPFKAQRHIYDILASLELKKDLWGIRDIKLSTIVLEDVLERIWDDTAADAERRKARLQQVGLTSELRSFVTGESEFRKTPTSDNTEALSCDQDARTSNSSHLSSLACTLETCEWSDDQYIVRMADYIGNPSVFTEARMRWHLARTAWNHMIRNVLGVFWKRLHTIRKDGWLLYVQLFLPPLITLSFNVSWLFSPKYPAIDRTGWAGRDQEELNAICAGGGVPSSAFINQPVAWTMVMKAAFSLVAIELIPSAWGNYLTTERATGNKIHQHAAGIPLTLYWLGELIWDFCVFVVTSSMCVIVLLITKSPILTRGTWYWFGLAMFLYSMSAAAGVFFLSFVFTSGTTIQIVMMSGGVLIPFLVGALHAVGPIKKTQYLTFICLLVPHSGFAQICYSLVFDCSCGPNHNECPVHFGSLAMTGWPLVYMTLECIIYFGGVIFIDALKHDPWLSSYAKKLRCFDPTAVRKKFKLQHFSSSIPINEGKLKRFSMKFRRRRSPLDSDSSSNSCLQFGVEEEKQLVTDEVRRLEEREAPVSPRLDRSGASNEGEPDYLLVADGISKWKLAKHIARCGWWRNVGRIAGASNPCGRRARYIICDRSHFAVQSEQVLGFVGLNGCGMSSVLNILSGKTTPTEGRLWMNKVDLQEHPHARWGKVGFCSQSDTILEPRMTGRETLEMFGRIGLIEREYLRRTVIPEALAMVGLKDMKNRSVGSYSQGDRRKLSFILSLLTGARILVLDSPTLGMDVTSRRRIWHVIDHLKRNFGKAIVIASPVPAECEALADKIAYMQHGKITAIGPMEAVKNYLGHSYELLVNAFCAKSFDTPVYSGATPIHETAELLYSRLLEDLEEAFQGARLVEILGSWGRFVVPLPLDDDDGEALPQLLPWTTAEGRRRNSATTVVDQEALSIRHTYAAIRQQEIFHRASLDSENLKPGTDASPTWSGPRESRAATPRADGGARVSLAEIYAWIDRHKSRYRILELKISLATLETAFVVSENALP